MGTELKIGTKVRIKDAKFFGKFESLPNETINCDGVDVSPQMLELCGQTGEITNEVFYHDRFLYNVSVDENCLWSAEMLEPEDKKLDIMRGLVNLNWNEKDDHFVKSFYCLIHSCSNNKNIPIAIAYVKNKEDDNMFVRIHQKSNKADEWVGPVTSDNICEKILCAIGHIVFHTTFEVIPLNSHQYINLTIDF